MDISKARAAHHAYGRYETLFTAISDLEADFKKNGTLGTFTATLPRTMLPGIITLGKDAIDAARKEVESL